MIKLKKKSNKKREKLKLESASLTRDPGYKTMIIP